MGTEMKLIRDAITFPFQKPFQNHIFLFFLWFHSNFVQDGIVSPHILDF